MISSSGKQLRKDPVTGRWVIVNQKEPLLKFPTQGNVKSSKTCPFCPGNEAMTPPEIFSHGRKGGKNAQDWTIRVVPNKFPALRIEENTDKTAIGIYDKVGGFGAHEVIVETPNHALEMADMPIEQVELVLRVYRERCLDLRKDPRLKYILIFKNYGQDSGASMEHPHSQLIALPVVPSRVLQELKGAAKHAEFSERCIFCDMLDQEKTEKARTVFSEYGFVAVMPFASRFPFETWLMPQQHAASFDAISDEGLKAMAKGLKTVLSKLKTALHDPPFNFMIHTLPLGGKETDSFHWHMEIIPHLTQVSGFELGTGFYVNPTPPELAAEILRKQP